MLLAGFATLQIISSVYYGLMTAITLAVAGLMLALGTPLAYLMARYSFRGKRLLETLVELDRITKKNGFLENHFA